MGPEEQVAMALVVAGPCIIALILCIALIRWFRALGRASVFQQRPPAVQLSTAIETSDRRRDSRASSFFDTKSPIDDEEAAGNRFEGRGGSTASQNPSQGGREWKGGPKGKQSKKPSRGGKTMDVDIELGVAEPHYTKVQRSRPTTQVDFAKRLEVDIAKSSLSLPTLEYSPRGY